MAFSAGIETRSEAGLTPCRTLDALPQRKVREVVVRTRREARVVQEEEVYRTVEVRAVLGRALTRDAVGAAGLTVVGHRRSDELTVGTGRVADRGPDAFVVNR